VTRASCHSLLFVAGAVAALGGMDIAILLAVLGSAAVLGNMLNYQIGRYFGPKVFQWENSRFFNKAALEKTHAFYEKHGGKTLVLSRFLPLFAPSRRLSPASAMNRASLFQSGRRRRGSAR
jgi:membrane-associated protein